MAASARGRFASRLLVAGVYAHELDLPDLRVWPLTCYPCLVFYVERPEHIDVWRILHGKRDIPASMHEARPDDVERG